MNKDQAIGKIEPRFSVTVGANEVGIYPTVMLEQYNEDECSTHEIAIHPADVHRVIDLLKKAYDRAFDQRPVPTIESVK